MERVAIVMCNPSGEDSDREIEVWVFNSTQTFEVDERWMYDACRNEDDVIRTRDGRPRSESYPRNQTIGDRGRGGKGDSRWRSVTTNNPKEGCKSKQIIAIIRKKTIKGPLL